jgi:hypothetical protein
MFVCPLHSQGKSLLFKFRIESLDKFCEDNIFYISTFCVWLLMTVCVTWLMYHIYLIINIRSVSQCVYHSQCVLCYMVCYTDYDSICSERRGAVVWMGSREGKRLVCRWLVISLFCEKVLAPFIFQNNVLFFKMGWNKACLFC